MGLSLPARAHCPCANTPSPPVWQQCRPRSIPPALPGSPSQPTDPSPHRHGPAKWTATAFIGITRHCQMLMALAEKEPYPCVYQVILTLFLKTLLPRTPEVNVIIGIIYISASFVAFQCYRPGLDANVISRVFDDGTPFCVCDAADRGETANAQVG